MKSRVRRPDLAQEHKIVAIAADGGSPLRLTRPPGLLPDSLSIVIENAGVFVNERTEVQRNLGYNIYVTRHKDTPESETVLQPESDNGLAADQPHCLFVQMSEVFYKSIFRDCLDVVKLYV